MTTKQLLLFITLIIILVSAKAQPGALDLSFDPGTGADSTIFVTAVQPDGKILIGGRFTSYNGQSVGCIARLHPDGSLDNTFNAGGIGSNRTILALTVLPDDKILVGGNVTKYNNDSVYRMMRLLPDGTIDTTFKAAAFLTRTAHFAIRPDGKIYVGGTFLSVNGLPYINLARLESNGKLDTTFNTLNALNGTVEALALQPDGKLLVGGSFTSYKGVQGYRIVRVNPDGSADTTFNPGIGGAGSTVEDIVLLPNGKILLVGEFTFYNGSTVGHAVRTNPDGTIDFTYLQTPGANRPVHSNLLLPNGNYLYGGDFSTLGGQVVSRIASVKPDGILDTTFNPGSGPDIEVWNLSLYGDQVIATGDFKTYNGIARGRIARIYNCLTTKPDSIKGISIVNCPNTTLTYSISPVQGADKYEWKLPTGWTGSSDSTSITAISNGKPGTISVRAFSNACGYSYASTLAITQILPPSPAICLVTVDSQSTHNIIMWEKQPTSLIDSFCIYRETTNNVYTKIASLPYDSLSEYHDYDANPNVTSYRYKLTTVDTCGVESNLSVFHNTIHLQYLGMGNFQWTFYQIQPGINPVISFNVYRDNFNNGNFSQIGFVSGSNATFTDVSYSSFPDANYVVDVNWGISCTPSRAVNTTRSNKRPLKENLWLSVDEVSNKRISISPNPVKGSFRVQHEEGVVITKATLCNAMGQKVLTENHLSPKPEFNVEGLSAGVYFLRLESPAGISQHRLLLE